MALLPRFPGWIFVDPAVFTPDLELLAVVTLIAHPLLFRELCAEQALKSYPLNFVINASGLCLLTGLLTK